MYDLGVSGRYPKSRNIKELAESLLSKRILTSDVKERWNIDHSHLPAKLAKIDDLDRFDAGFFGIHYRQANVMDPLLRIFLEVTFEAILDAGLHPSELEGSRTGVFVGSSFSDIEIRNLMDLREPQNFGLTGLLRTFVANRISYNLKLKGPSIMIDTACSSSANALEAAFKAIRSGKCDNAIVGGAQLCLHPDIAIQFERLGVLSLDGVCRVFDQDANGYVRSDTISCILLQKVQNARRVYGQVVHAKVNTNGFSDQGINFPSSEDQQQLLIEILEESGINPSDLSYLEAHGTGTKVGDAEEINAIDEAIARRRDKPLWMGSVKCSIGHSEPASGLGSLSKVIIAFERGLIPPNINLKKIKDSLHAVLEGRLKIVTETTELEGQEAIVGINNFGFGGNNCHMLVRRFKKIKINEGLPEDNIPRLVCVSGRTEEAVLTLLNELNAKPLDYEHVALLHHVFKEDIKNHIFRGFSIMSKKGPLKISFKNYRQQTRFYIYFGRFDYSYKNLGQLLLEFPVFRDAILKINKQLLSKNLNIVDVIFKKQIDVKQDMLGAIAVQIGFVELLKNLNVYPTAVYGEHFGKLAAEYYYGTLKLEEVLQKAYSCFKLAEKVDKIELNSYLSQKFDHLNHDNTTRNEDESDRHRDSINIKILSNSKNSTILNISNRHLSTKDILLTDGDVNKFLEFLGSLYEQGHNLHLHQLYPEIEYPVSRGTSMIAPSIKWHHENTWYTNKFDSIIKPETEQIEFEISRFLDDFRDLTGHVIDGRNLVPAVEYLRLVWKAFSQYQRLNLNNTPVVFENCKFLRAVVLPSDGTTHLIVVIHQSSGYFEVLQGNLLIVSGRIFSPVDINSHKSNLIPFDFDDSDCTQVLMQDEIYRELYLRGYNYSGLFKGIIKCNTKTSVGMIQWENNWTTFIDKMLQIKILQLDSRLLFIPVGIDRLIIDPIEHLQCTKEENEAVLAVHVYKESGIIKSGGIEIHGVQAKSIAKRKPRLEPVLEKHTFVPNEGQLDLATSVRVSIQIILENNPENDFSAVELTENLSDSETKFLLPLVSQVLEDIPSIKPNLILSIKGKIEGEIEDIPGITRKDFPLTANSNLSLIVGNRVLEKSNVAAILNALNNGFVLTRENVKFASSNFKNIEIITEYLIGNEKMILFRKPVETERIKYVEISSDHFEWLSNLQQTIKSEPNIVVYSQNEELSGLMGFINCLRREPGHSKVTCFLMMDEAPKFDPQHPFYQNQLKKNLALNVYKNSKWGTYRHLLLGEMEEIESEHVRVNTIRTGDLSTLKWFKGPLTQRTSLKEDHILIQNCYSGLNFKDVMIASGRLRKEDFSMNRLEQECWLGLEFAGIDGSGKRVAGMVTQSGLSTFLAVPKHTLWQVPDSWTLEDAATVTVVYLTVIYSLLKITVVKPGVSILIHSATGGVGLAALNVCLYHGCNIFVTVGTNEKRDYLKKHYPQIPASHIGNSRDTSFEEMIKTETKGRGVDIVLNSLTEDKLIASIRCLATGGNLVEIGKYDLANNNELNLLLFEKQITYHGISIDAVRSLDVNKWMINRLEEGIRLGFVKPLPRKLFKRDEIQTAFRYMTAGKHIGKVLIKTRENDEETPTAYFKGLPKFYCNPEKCYIIVGGLGGVGLELADWLILKGASKLVLVTSTGIKSGYQSQRLSLWASYNTKIHISKANVTTKEGCIQLIKEAHDLGSVDAIFNLAVVLQDALFEDQTEEKFHISFASKVYSTKYLDEASRNLCADLKYFVVFSSVSCGRGNAGQTNYGMANSIMERICEKRKKDGLPALAIQWGAIGDVGLVAQMQKENKELVIGGTLQQKISSCLEVLDTLLNQDSPVVSSMVVAEKSRRNFDAESPAEAVASILGIKDMKIISPHASLAELGMDSMTGTEVVQVLEKDFEIYVTAKDVRSLTFAKLTEMKNNRTYKEPRSDKALKGTSLLLQYLPENRNNELIKLPSLVNEETDAHTIFVFSGIEGVFKPLEQITKNIKAHVFGVPYNYNNPEDSIEQSAKNILPHLKKHVMKQTTFHILGYSYGVLIALEVAHLLEKNGYIGNIVAIDGSPAYSVASIRQLFADDTEAEFQTSLIFKIISIVLPIEILEQNKEKFLKCSNFEERLDLALAMIPPDPSKDELDKQGAIVVYKRFKAVLNYNFVHDKIQSNLNLIKAKYPIITEIDNDYKLSEICEQPVQVHEVDGDHATMLSQSHLVEIVNKLLS